MYIQIVKFTVRFTTSYITYPSVLQSHEPHVINTTFKNKIPFIVNYYVYM